jgi:hypothetical protein
VQVANLSREQKDCLLKFYGVTAATVPPTDSERVALLLEKLPPSPLKEAERAMREASNAARGRINNYADQFGHLLRIVNQQFGMDVRTF